jgi:hybrid cluster-associated redox disulfide protein
MIFSAGFTHTNKRNEKRRVTGMAKITPDMTIAQVLTQFPATAQVFMGLGIHCLGCPSATGESVHEAALKHGQNPEDLMQKLNAAAG